MPFGIVIGIGQGMGVPVLNVGGDHRREKAVLG